MEVKTKRPLSVRVLAVLLSVFMITGVFGIIDVGHFRASAANDTYGVVGSFNNWDNDVIMTDDNGDGIYEAVTEIERGNNQFKIRANRSWDDAWGVANENGITWNSQTNFEVEVEITSYLYVYFDTTSGDPMTYSVSYYVEALEEPVNPDFEYEVLDDGTISITGYTGSDTDIVIPSVIDGKSVTTIGYRAFEYFFDLTSVIIPNSVTTIEEVAFLCCDSLTSVDIPDSVTTIGKNAFEDCRNLTNINVDVKNKNYLSIDGVLFSSFSKNNLTLVQYPSGRSGEYVVPDLVKTIGDDAFYHCYSLTSVNISDSVTTIGKNAFENCINLTSVSIPNSVTTIGNSAFRGCKSLTSIDIPNSITKIEDAAFSYCCSLTDIVIPNSVTTIEDYTFANCDNLTSVDIPNSITKIEDAAFFYCCSLTDIVIPNSVTTIGNATFRDCRSLTKVVIPDSVKKIGNLEFFDCYSLTDIVIPNSVTTIGDSAFHGCSSLTSIDIPNSVTTIGSRAFEFCNNLTSVDIPDSVITIGNVAFSSCDKLKNINVATENKNYLSIDGVLFSKDKTTLIQYPSGRSGEYTIPSTVTTIGDCAFYNCESLTSVDIPNSVTTIGEGAFAWCINLTSIDIPNSVTTIGDEAFYSCDNLTSVDIPNSVTTIGYSAFENCSSLASIVIPNSVTTIGDEAFYSCDNLTSVDIPNSVTTIGNATFKYCDNLTIYGFAGSYAETYAKENGIAFHFVALENNSSVTATSVVLGQGITLKGAATGGTGEYQYAIAAKHSTASSYTVLKNYNTTATKYWKPSKAGTYTVVIKVKDSSGEIVQKFFTIKVAETALKNNSTVSTTSITLGQGITLTCAAEGGMGDYQYEISAKHSTASEYTTLKGYNTTATKYWKPAKTGTYSIIIKVKDSAGTVVQKSFTIAVKSSTPLTNNSTVTATTVTLGQGITLKGAAIGGTGEYQYAIAAKHSTASNYTVLKNYDSVTKKYWKPSKTGTYTVVIKVKDSSGEVVQKFFKITVK